MKTLPSYDIEERKTLRRMYKDALKCTCATLNPLISRDPRTHKKLCAVYRNFITRKMTFRLVGTASNGGVRMAFHHTKPERFYPIVDNERDLRERAE